jgi:hypothetical protein
MQTGATPDENTQPDSNDRRQGSPLPSPEHEALKSAIQRLETLCQNPAEISEQYMLWFRPDEFDEVNDLWSSSGIEAVVDRWGEERRYHIDSPEDLDYEPTDPEQPLSVPEVHSVVPMRLLQIMHFEPSTAPDDAQSGYYRAAALPLTEPQEQRLLEDLESAGLIDVAVPHQDSVTGADLSGSKVTGIKAHVEWYGPENWYGDGSVFSLSLEISRPGETNLFSRLQVDEPGEVRAHLLNPEFFETGYEGHDHRQVVLNSEQMRLLAAVVESFLNSNSADTPGYTVGAWFGNSFSED